MLRSRVAYGLIFIAMATVGGTADALGGHGYNSDEKTFYRTWRMAPSIPANWDPALSNGATMWDNVPNQCHDFQQILAQNQHILLYRYDGDGQGYVYAFAWYNHQGIAFDQDETWYLNVNGIPGSTSLDLWSLAGHELGHVLSLAHSGQEGYNESHPTMAVAYPYGATYRRSLEQYDRSHIQALYAPGTC